MSAPGLKFFSLFSLSGIHAGANGFLQPFRFFSSSAGKTLSSGNIYSLIHESPMLHFYCRKAPKNGRVEMTET